MSLNSFPGQPRKVSPVESGGGGSPDTGKSFEEMLARLEDLEAGKKMLTDPEEIAVVQAEIDKTTQEYNAKMDREAPETKDVSFE